MHKTQEKVGCTCSRAALYRVGTICAGLRNTYSNLVAFGGDCIISLRVLTLLAAGLHNVFVELVVFAAGLHINGKVELVAFAVGF